MRAFLTLLALSATLVACTKQSDNQALDSSSTTTTIYNSSNQSSTQQPPPQTPPAPVPPPPLPDTSNRPDSTLPH